MQWERVLLLLLPVGVLAVFYVLGVALCPSRVVFGIPCPGCGLTRASVALVTLELERAMAMHPLVPLLLPLVGWFFAATLWNSAGLPRRRPALPERLPKWVWTALVVLMLGVWAVRLAGGLGGPPDPVDPARGLIGRIVATVL